MTRESRLFDAGDPEQEDARPVGTVGEPVVVRHTRDHRFVKKPIPEGKDKPSPGCAVCNGAKGAMQHIGTPQSFNALARVNPHTYQNWKKHWSPRLAELLEAARLPRPLAHVRAHGLVCFPDRTQRDQGNFRVLLEKVLGDVLVNGAEELGIDGWLEDDNWDYYEFGNLRRTYAKGEAWTEVTLVPTLPLAKETT